MQFFCPRWGSEHLEWESFFRMASDAGYDGVEWAIAADTPSFVLDEVWSLSERYRLPVIAQHFDTIAPDFERHRVLYEAWFSRIAGFPALKINSQTGRDVFSADQNITLIDIASDYTRASGIPTCHELHRGKFSFSAQGTQAYFAALPSLRITFDVSHWVCVAESFLEDQKEALAPAMSRTDHIHARVGYPGGPQVTDPRLPEWKEALDIHLAWWDEIARLKGDMLTITPEFGPFPYMVRSPLTGRPIADQWNINLFMMNLLRGRYCPREYWPKRRRSHFL